MLGVGCGIGRFGLFKTVGVVEVDFEELFPIDFGQQREAVFLAQDPGPGFADGFPVAAGFRPRFVGGLGEDGRGDFLVAAEADLGAEVA